MTTQQQLMFCWLVQHMHCACLVLQPGWTSPKRERERNIYIYRNWGKRKEIVDLVEVQRFFGCQAAAWSKRNIWTHGIALNCLHSSWMQLAGWAVLICLAGFFSPCLWHCSQLFLHLALLTCVLPSFLAHLAMQVRPGSVPTGYAPQAQAPQVQQPAPVVSCQGLQMVPPCSAQLSPAPDTSAELRLSGQRLASTKPSCETWAAPNEQSELRFL